MTDKIQVMKITVQHSDKEDEVFFTDTYSEGTLRRVQQRVEVSCSSEIVMMEKTEYKSLLADNRSYEVFGGE